jgi:hypothetical protein
MLKRLWLTGSVALMFLLGMLVVAGPAQAVSYSCEPLGAGTQAYAECMVRAEAREAAPIVPPSQQTPLQVTDPAAPVVDEAATEVWQLALAGVLGALVAIGAALGVSRLGHRQSVTAH